MSDVDERTQQLDYELGAEISADTPARLKALGDPLRQLLLDLVLERAMSVSELAARVQRPKSTVAHHVDLLTDVGLLQVVRTQGACDGGALLRAHGAHDRLPLTRS